MKHTNKLKLTKEVIYQLTLSQARQIKGGAFDDDGPGTTRTTRTKTEPPKSKGCSGVKLK